jgi:hypothetical protein
VERAGRAEPALGGRRGEQRTDIVLHHCNGGDGTRFQQKPPSVPGWFYRFDQG